MTVRFVLPPEVRDEGLPAYVEYAWDRPREPIIGEVVTAEGDDPDFPRGNYSVRWVNWLVGLRGPRVFVVELTWIGPLPEGLEAP